MSNDFIPFAVGSSANVTVQPDYAANTTLTQNGFQSGIAKSADLNKVWRQSSIMAAVLAQFIVQQTGQNAIDDGTTATLLTNLTAAIKASPSGVVGQSRNLVSSVTAASSTKTVTADELIVETALGGLRYCLSGLNLTGNLATQMDTGNAPASGFVAEYVIYNPDASISSTNPRLLYQNATAVKVPEVYGGANMPAGYTASALVSVWPTNSSGQFGAGYWQDRTLVTANTTIASTVSTISSYTLVNMSTIIPLNARKISGNINVTATNGLNSQINIAPLPGIGVKQLAGGASTGGINAANCPFDNFSIITPQSLYWLVSLQSGTFEGALIGTDGYTI